ncbi:MAG: hypothetical protein ACK559_23080, partial [bacterium]
VPHRLDEAGVHRIARPRPDPVRQRRPQVERRRVGDRGERVTRRHVLGLPRGRVGIRLLRIVVAAVKQGVIRASRIEAHAVALHVQLVAGGRGRPQDLVVPHAVGKRVSRAEEVVHRVEPVVDRIRIPVGARDAPARVDAEGDEEPRIPV